MSLKDYFIYKLNFLLWRLRSFVFFLTLFFFWSAVFQEKTRLLGYQKSQMFAYLMGSAFLKGIVLGSRSIDELAGSIRSGRIVNWLLKPVDIFKIAFARDLIAKLLDFVFCFGEIWLVVKISHFPFYLPKNFYSWSLFFGAVFLSVVLYFNLLVVFASLAFLQTTFGLFAGFS
jgi:ABC-type uncharacterized transport system permease subunit